MTTSESWFENNSKVEGRSCYKEDEQTRSSTTPTTTSATTTTTRGRNGQSSPDPATSLELPGNLDPHHVLVVSGDGSKQEEKPLRIDGSGIAFEEGVPGHVRSALKRLHQNLGHPRTPDLVRHPTLWM